MHYLWAHSPSRREWCLCAPRAAAEGAVAFWEEKIKDRKTGLWQKTALVTERDLSIARTIPVSHPVIMGFITQPCTSLSCCHYTSPYLCVYMHPQAVAQHTERDAQRGRRAANRIYDNTFLGVFCNLLKEMYASKQNVVNPLAWLLLFFYFFRAVGEKQNHSWVGARQRHSNKEMSKEILITDCWMPIESCIHRQLQQDSVHSVFFYSFKSSLHMQPARTAFEISGASRWFPNIHLCGCGKNLFSQACNYKKDIFIYSHDEVFVLDDYMEKKQKKGCSECVCSEKPLVEKIQCLVEMDVDWPILDVRRWKSGHVQLCLWLQDQMFSRRPFQPCYWRPKADIVHGSWASHDCGDQTRCFKRKNNDALPTTPKWFLCLNIIRA